MQVEELADLLRQCTVQASAQAVHLIAGGRHRMVQTFQLAGYFLGGNALLGHIQRMRQADPGASERTSARRSMACQQQAHQVSSSNRRSNNDSMSAMALASFSPSTLTITGVPWPAASSMTPMMLLA